MSRSEHSNYGSAGESKAEHDMTGDRWIDEHVGPGPAEVAHAGVWGVAPVDFDGGMQAVLQELKAMVAAEMDACPSGSAESYALEQVSGALFLASMAGFMVGQVRRETGVTERDVIGRLLVKSIAGVVGDDDRCEADHA